MSFIDKINRFATNPVRLNHKRSKFNLSHKVATTFVSGKLIPLMVDEVLPGDTIKIDLATVCRSITPAVPVMDQAYLDVFAFWCPARILTVHDKDFQKVHGENIAGSWAPATESTLSNTGNTFKISSDSNAIEVQSVADYMGFPIGFYHSTAEFSRLPFNGYFEIWNEFFRDENTQTRLDWKSYTNGQFLNKIYGQYSTQSVNKFHDYFTSSLNSPQKGNSVLLPLGSVAPVITGADTTSSATNALHWKTTGGVAVTGTNDIKIATGGNTATVSAGSFTPSSNILPSNLYADLSNATAASVNDLRQAFAVQKLLEKDARGGTRYRSMLYSHYGVIIPDNTVQVPEYLGGKRIPLNMLQVLQTSETSASSPLGSTGAFSNTADSSYLFTKSFSEFGYIYILVCVRPNQSYCQGISRMWTRNRRYDFYYPVFANLGEQAVKTAEIYADNTSTWANGAWSTVFGYQEAWAEYRFKPSRVSGFLSWNQSTDLVAPKWTYCNKFSSAPVLNSSFMIQGDGQINRTLAASGSSTYQFILDGWVNYTAWREMPYFSVPGLIDHH